MLQSRLSANMKLGSKTIEMIQVELVSYTSELKSSRFEHDHCHDVILKHVEQETRKFFNVSNSIAVGF